MEQMSMLLLGIDAPPYLTMRSHSPGPEIARKLIEEETKALSELRPDLVIHGFWPMGAIARRTLGTYQTVP